MGRVSAQVIGFVILIAALGGSVIYKDFASVKDDVKFTVDFSRGTNIQDETGIIEAVAEVSKNPRYKLIVVGHTGTSGNDEANKELSIKRAEHVRDILINDYNIEREKITVIGQGGSEPLERLSDESLRAYQRRLGRAEIIVDK